MADENLIRYRNSKTSNEIPNDAMSGQKSKIDENRFRRCCFRSLRENC